MANIFIVEDNPEVQRVLGSTLSDYGLVFANGVQEARGLLAKRKDVDLFLLDILLPDGNGMDLCTELQGNPETHDAPIVFLTAKDATSDKVCGLSLGVEDYITKPFDPMELRARVLLRLKKSAEKRGPKEIIQKRDLVFNLPLQRLSLRVPEGERVIELTSFEFKLLLHLAKNEDQILTREQLITEVWGEKVHVLDRTIDSHMSNLRRKIKDSVYTIKAVYGQGYRLSVQG